MMISTQKFAGWEGMCRCMCEEINHMIMKTTVCANYGYIYYNYSLCWMILTIGSSICF
jgi:hypothetical protein